MTKYIRNETLDELSEIDNSKRYCLEIQDTDSGDVINYEYVGDESIASKLHNTKTN